MIKHLLTLGIGTVFLSSIASVAWSSDGHGGGNGGDAVVCFNSTATRDVVLQIVESNQDRQNKIDPLGGGRENDIQSVRLLDLYEAELRSDYRPLPLSGSRDEILAAHFARLRQNSNLPDIFEYWSRDYRWYDTENGIFEVDDSDHRILFSENCLILQMGYLMNVGSQFEVYVDKRLERRLPVRDQVAFYLHELALGMYRKSYLKERRKVPTSTMLVRRFVAYMLSEEILEDDFSSLETKYYEAVGKEAKFDDETILKKRMVYSFGDNLAMDSFVKDNVIAPAYIPIYLRLPFATLTLTDLVKIRTFLDSRKYFYTTKLTTPFEYNGLNLAGETAFRKSDLSFYFSHLAKDTTVGAIQFPAGTRVVMDEGKTTLEMRKYFELGSFIYKPLNDSLIFGIQSDGSLSLESAIEVDLPPQRKGDSFIHCNLITIHRNGLVDRCYSSIAPVAYGPYSQLIYETKDPRDDKSARKLRYVRIQYIIRFTPDGRPAQGVLREDIPLDKATCLTGATLNLVNGTACTQAQIPQNATGPEGHFAGRVVNAQWLSDKTIIRFNGERVRFGKKNCRREVIFDVSGNFVSCK